MAVCWVLNCEQLGGGLSNGDGKLVCSSVQISGVRKNSRPVSLQHWRNILWHWGYMLLYLSFWSAAMAAMTLPLHDLFALGSWILPELQARHWSAQILYPSLTQQKTKGTSRKVRKTQRKLMGHISCWINFWKCQENSYRNCDTFLHRKERFKNRLLWLGTGVVLFFPSLAVEEFATIFLSFSRSSCLSLSPWKILLVFSPERHCIDCIQIGIILSSHHTL